MPDIDRNIAILFIAAAEKSAEAARLGREPFHTPESVRADFRREVEPLMLGIAALAEKDGVTFAYRDRTDEAKDPVNSVIQITTANGHHALCLRATTIVRGGLYISLGFQENDGKSTSYREDNSCKSFADARDMLAQWFARHAPERIADLKELLLPPPPTPAVELEKPMRVDGPLRLRKPA